MLMAIPKRWDYLRRHPVDVVVVLLKPPFLTSLFNGVRLLRLVRVARLLRLEPLITWMSRSGGLKFAAGFTALVVLVADRQSRAARRRSGCRAARQAGHDG
jgi:hypothetical protein